MKWRIDLVLVLLIAIPLLTVFLISPGAFTIDESVYHAMLENLLRGRGLEIWNGYAEFPSPALVWPSVAVDGDRLVARYPYALPFLALPLYAVLGFRALFVVNAVALAGTVLLTYSIAKRLFGKPHVARAACLVLVATTFARDMAHTAWPHLPAVAGILGAVRLGIYAMDAKQEDARVRGAVGAGLLMGLAMAIRLDSVFALPGVLLPLLYVNGLASAAAVLVATLPGLLLLSATNYVRFDTLSPFSYGVTTGYAAGILPYLPIAAGGLVVSGGAWLIVHTGWPVWMRRRRVVVLGGVIFAVAVVIESLTAGSIVRAVGSILVDMRFRELDIVERWAIRSPSGAVIYYGVLKKALLQSCPYLVALVILLRHVPSGETKPLILLAVIPVVYAGVFGLLGWHGGLALFQRYLVPALPFTSMLVAQAWSRLSEVTESRPRLQAVAIGIVIVGFVLAIDLRQPASQEFLFLTMPLLLSGALLAAVVALDTRFGRYVLIQGSARAFFMAALAWAAVVGIGHDYLWSQTVRHINHTLSEGVASAVGDDALVISGHYAAFGPLLQRDKVRVALLLEADLPELRRLVRFHLQQDRPVYALLNKAGWELVEQGGVFERACSRAFWEFADFTLRRCA